MIHHLWTILCSHSIVDKESNNISLVDVLEQLTLPTPADFPVTVPIAVELVSLWSREVEDQPAREAAKVDFLSPSGQTLQEEPFEVDLSAHTRTRTIIRIFGLSFPEPGLHRFRVSLKDAASGEWKEVTRLPLSLLISA